MYCFDKRTLHIITMTTTPQIIEGFLTGLQSILTETFRMQTCLIEITQLSISTDSSVFSSRTWLGINPTLAPDQAEHFTVMMEYQLPRAMQHGKMTLHHDPKHLNLTGRAERLYRQGDGPDWVVGVVSTAPTNISEIIATTVLIFLPGIQTLLPQRFESLE